MSRTGINARDWFNAQSFHGNLQREVTIGADRLLQEVRAKREAEEQAQAEDKANDEVQA